MTEQIKGISVLLMIQHILCFHLLTSASLPSFPSLPPIPLVPRVTRLAALTAVQVVGLDDPFGVLSNAGTFDLSEERKKQKKNKLIKQRVMDDCSTFGAF